MAKVVYEFDQCEAAKANGARCTHEGVDYIHNYGAPFGFLVCGTHLNQGKRLLETKGEIPATWGKYNFDILAIATKGENK